MKRILSLALFALVASAQANTLLEVKISSLRPGISGEHTALNVTAKGEVSYYKTSVEQPAHNRLVLVKTLSPAELSTLQNQIKEAAGSTEKAVKHSFCLAIPVWHTTYTAFQGSVFLATQDSPCGDLTYNPTDAAQGLVAQLKEYVAEGQKQAGN